MRSLVDYNYVVMSLEEILELERARINDEDYLASLTKRRQEIEKKSLLTQENKNIGETILSVIYDDEENTVVKYYEVFIPYVLKKSIIDVLQVKFNNSKSVKVDECFLFTKDEEIARKIFNEIPTKMYLSDVEYKQYFSSSEDDDSLPF